MEQIIKAWIPAYAGMTKGETGMTKGTEGKTTCVIPHLMRNPSLIMEQIINIMDSRLRGNDKGK